MSTIRFSTIIGPDQLIRPPDGVQLAPGKAEITVVQREAVSQPATSRNRESLRDRLARAAIELGISELPADLAANHDHYAHGAPKDIDRP